MQPILPDFSHSSVLVVGDIMLDRYWFGDMNRISPEAPVPVVQINSDEERPGGAANVALNLAALGVNVDLLGVTGDDAVADSLQQQLESLNIRVDFQRLSSIRTITKLRVLSRHQQLMRLDFEDSLQYCDQEDLLARCKAHLQQAKVMVLSDYNKGTLVESSQKLIKLAKKAKVPVVVDPKGKDFSRYSGADIITPNIHEFQTIVGHCADEQEITRKGLKLLKDYKIGALLLTRGERGMTLLRPKHESIHLPTRGREVFDVTGAGDTVVAVLAAALAANDEITNAMAVANTAAGLVVGKLGAATVSVPELRLALEGKDLLGSGILNQSRLALAVEAAKSQGEKIVFTNGCFDILHAGHVAYLKDARALGDRLIVAVNADESVSALKGPTRPVNALEQRMAVLERLDVVDWVVPFYEETPENLLQTLKPDYLVKGGDYGIEGVVGADIVLAYGGEVKVLSLVQDISTTSIIERLVE